MVTPKGSRERLLEIMSRVAPNFQLKQPLYEAPLQYFSDRDELRVEKAMLEEYGETSNPNVAGFITGGGHMIDFSGGGFNTRGQDHRNVGHILDDLGIDLGKYKGGEWKNLEGRVGMYAIMDMGIIRFIPESWGFNMHKMPTQEQFELLRELLPQKKGKCILDLVDGADKANIEHERDTPVDFIIDGIKNFYRYGDKPRGYNDYEEDQDLMEGYIDELLDKKNKINENIERDLDINVIPIEQFIKFLTVGLLSPDGRFVQSTGFGNPHMAAAQYITYGMPEFKKLPQYTSTPDDYLIQRGWIKITSTIGGDNGIYFPYWYMWWNHELTPIQQKIYNEFSKKFGKPEIIHIGSPEDDERYANPNKRNLNELHNLNDFKFKKTQNIVQRQINNGSVTLNDIEPNRYFIMAFDYAGNPMGSLSTLSKQECMLNVEQFKKDQNVIQILVEKPEVGAQAMNRTESNRWIVKNDIYGNENQTKLNLQESTTIFDVIDNKRTIIF